MRNFIVDHALSPEVNQPNTMDRISPSNRQAEAGATEPSLRRSLLVGALGFAFVSFCVFATVAFAERWMYSRLGLLGAYLVWTCLFILPGGGVLGSLVVGRLKLPRFYLLFAVAFFTYAAGWVSAYF